MTGITSKYKDMLDYSLHACTKYLSLIKVNKTETHLENYYTLLAPHEGKLRCFFFFFTEFITIIQGLICNNLTDYLLHF